MAQRIRNPPPVLTLLTRKDCCLCDEMKDAVATVAPEFAAEVRIQDVDGDPALQEQFGDEVPVLLVNGRKAFKYRATVRELRRRLADETRGSRYILR